MINIFGRARTTARKPLPSLAPLALLALLVALPGCRQAAHGESTAAEKPQELAPITVTVAPVEQRSVQRHITAVGTLNGFEVFTITPKVEGRVESIHAEVGDRVPPDHVLLVIDPTDYQLAVDEAQRGLDQELAKLGLNEIPEQFDTEVLPSVSRARLIVKNAQRRFERERGLAQRNAIAQQDFEQIETDLKVAEATLEHVRLEARATWASVLHRQAVLAQARQRLEDAKVVAPRMDSASEVSAAKYVVAQRMVSVGEMVRAFPSTPVFELVMDDVLKLQANIPERYAGKIHVGQAVAVHVEAYPGESFPAEIVRVNPTVNPENRTFEIEAHVANADHRLKHGSFAKAEIVTQESDQALVAPLESIVRYAGIVKVFRVEEGQAFETLVRIGARGEGWVELLGDLQTDDLVVTSGQSQLADGTEVRIRESTSSADSVAQHTTTSAATTASEHDPQQ